MVEKHILQIMETIGGAQVERDHARLHNIYVESDCTVDA